MFVPPNQMKRHVWLLEWACEQYYFLNPDAKIATLISNKSTANARIVTVIISATGPSAFTLEICSH